jgi:hypothetical protein
LERRRPQLRRGLRTGLTAATRCGAGNQRPRRRLLADQAPRCIPHRVYQTARERTWPFRDTCQEAPSSQTSDARWRRRFGSFRRASPLASSLLRGPNLIVRRAAGSPLRPAVSIRRIRVSRRSTASRDEGLERQAVSARSWVDTAREEAREESVTRGLTRSRAKRSLRRGPSGSSSTSRSRCSCVVVVAVPSRRPGV